MNGDDQMDKHSIINYVFYTYMLDCLSTERKPKTILNRFRSFENKPTNVRS